MKKKVVYCMARNYYEPAIPSINSLLENGNIDEIYLIIEDDKYLFEHPKFKVINASAQTYIRPDSPNYSQLYTYMACIRVALCHILENESKVLSLDADTIILGDLSPLWDIPIDDYYLMAGREPHKTRGNWLAINGGVVMYNLDAMRDGMADILIDAMNRKRYPFVDQDAINEYCQGKILELPPEYNVHNWSVKTDKEPVIVHYAGYRDWSAEALVSKYNFIPVEEKPKKPRVTKSKTEAKKKNDKK